jgi:hypothetical protein
MQRPKTVEEYVDLVKQALFETEELRAGAEYDMEELDKDRAFLITIEEELRNIYQSMLDGTYMFENRDLEFMDLVKKRESDIPFTYLLRIINETHREGLYVSTQEGA